MTIQFEIKRDGTLIADGQKIGRFDSATKAADVAIRFAQDQGALYEILYPL